MFVWFVKVKIDRCSHLSNSFLYMFPLPVCFKRGFFIVCGCLLKVIWKTDGLGKSNDKRLLAMGWGHIAKSKFQNTTLTHR
jgi:hypothetical protein